MGRIEDRDDDFVTIRVPRAAAQQFEAQLRVGSTGVIFWAPVILVLIISFCVFAAGVLMTLVGINNFYRDNPWSGEFLGGPPLALAGLFFAHLIVRNVQEFRRIRRRDADAQR